MRYAAYGHAIASATAFPCLPRSLCHAADITIEVTPAPAPPARWPAPPEAGSAPWLQVVRTEAGCVLRFEPDVTCSVTPDGRTIRVHGHAPLSDTVQHLLVDQVLPLVIAYRGHLVLHGAGLRLGGRGVGLVGPSGAGKSTLAGSLQSRGGVVFSDDALVMEVGDVGAAQPGAHASYPALRVWPDVLAAVGGGDETPSVAAYTEKRRVTLPANPPFSGAVPIDRVYVLDPEPGATIDIAPLRKRDAVMSLLTHSFVLDPDDARRLGVQFELACRLVEQVDLRVLRYPRDLARLRDVGTRLLDDLEM